MWIALSTSSQGCASRAVDVFFNTRFTPKLRVTSYELLVTSNGVVLGIRGAGGHRPPKLGGAEVDMRGMFFVGHGVHLNVVSECAESRSLVCHRPEARSIDFFPFTRLEGRSINSSFFFLGGRVGVFTFPSFP